LIYTSAKGRRKGKADILRELREEAPPKPGDEITVYTAEDIRIQQYGDTAIVAFRLVATTDKSGAKTVANYLNTGTFLKRTGKWQAVGWQATMMPAENEPKIEAPARH
jgi:ketosteroid isomerase-like protein